MVFFIPAKSLCAVRQFCSLHHFFGHYSSPDALADRGITVNTINPGPVDTGWADPELAQRVGRALPAGRWGTPEDVARVVCWLASDDSAWITGQVINCEGGFRRWAM